MVNELPASGVSIIVDDLALVPVFFKTETLIFVLYLPLVCEIFNQSAFDFASQGTVVTNPMSDSFFPAVFNPSALKASTVISSEVKYEELVVKYGGNSLVSSLCLVLI